MTDSFFTSPEPTAREMALATIGIDTAARTIAETAQFLDTDRIYHPAPGLSFADHRAAIVLGAPSLSPTAVDEMVAGVPVRRFEPVGRPSRGLHLHVHGGGWSMGSHRTTDGTLQPIADQTGLTVISIGYRLAPEHPYPAGADDVEAVARELAPNAPVATIGGESAGAHLAVLTLQRLARTGDSPFSGALLVFGAFDLAGGPDHQGPRTAYDLFLPDVPRQERRSAEFSPLYGDLAGLPPARFVVGTRDQLLTDTLWMAARWQLVADCQLEVACGAAHAFTLIDIPVSRQSKANSRAFLAAIADQG